MSDSTVVEEGEFTVFCIDEDYRDLNKYKRVLPELAGRLYCFDAPEPALAQLAHTGAHLILLTMQSGENDDEAIIKRIRTIDPSVSFLAVTNEGSVHEAVRAIKRGAAEVIEKPINPNQLATEVRKFRSVWEFEKQAAEHFKSAREESISPGIVGSSKDTEFLKQAILNVAPSSISVLIQGETGSGKEIVARAIHSYSERRDHEFVVVDCGSINESTIESELFGHVKGAFTGAQEPHSGLIRAADGGTLFLDEVGELPLSVQKNLLRVLQEREVRPVGGTKPVPVNIRVLAASNRDLFQEKDRGEFRADLFYRLNTITIKVPPLRDRPADIPELVEHFLALHNQHAHQGSGIMDIDDGAMEKLTQYHWPGNVRELQNAILRATVLCQGSTITEEHLPEEIVAPGQPGGSISPENNGDMQETPSDYSLESYTQFAIENAMRASHGNVKDAARLLQIGEATLHRKLRNYGMK